MIKIVTIPFFLVWWVCICGEISEELHTTFKEALCEAQCSISGISKAEALRCTSRGCACSSEDLNKLEEFYMDQPNSDLMLEPKLLCKTHNMLAMEWETSDELLTFVLEIRSNDSTWRNATKTRCLKWTVKNLTPDTYYQIRLWAVSAEQKVFGPYDSRWMRTTSFYHTPLPVSEINIIQTQLTEKQYNIEIEWKPAEDFSCFYNLLWYGCDEISIQNYQFREIRDIDNLFRFNITNLEIETEYTIKINSISGNLQRESNATEISYETPTCFKEFNNLTICVPPVPENVTVEEELSSDVEDSDSGTYNVRVTWSKPFLIPDNYTVSIMPWNSSIPYESKIVEGNETVALFYDIPLDLMYIVFIKVSSPAGETVLDIIKQVTNTSPKWFIASHISIIMGSVIGAVMIALVVFVILYRRYKIRKAKRICETPVSNYYGNSFKAKYVSDLKHSSPQYYTPEIINDEWQLKSNEIVVDKFLGEGAFGIVRKGYMKTSDGSKVEVAIKMLKGNPSVDEVKQFEHEIEIMKSVGTHPHLVSLLGCCSKLGSLGPSLIVEYCAKGDLLSYLRAVWEHLAGQPSEIRYINTQFILEDKIENNFSNKTYILSDDALLEPRDLLSFARQIALGMEYLSSLRVVHRDLALRNVLMCEDKTVKVADFGLSRDVYQDNVYLKTGAGKLPIKWMAVESLSHQQYTTQSDVWSFGVVLWEIVTLGGNPYATVSARDMQNLLRSGYRMECPKNCSAELYGIMKFCWKEAAKERPNFNDLRIMLEKLLESENRYVSLDVQY